jgi:hypothetical protein
MHHDFKGDCIYLAELDIHFPELSLGKLSLLPLPQEYSGRPEKPRPAAERKLLQRSSISVQLSILRLAMR